MQFIIPQKQSFYIGEIVERRGNEFTPVKINRTFENEPVNLDYVIYFVKGSNDIRTGLGTVKKLPQILFVTASKDNNVAWTFETEQERDVTHDKIMARFVDQINFLEAS